MNNRSASIEMRILNYRSKKCTPSPWKLINIRCARPISRYPLHVVCLALVILGIWEVAMSTIAPGEHVVLVKVNKSDILIREIVGIPTRPHADRAAYVWILAVPDRMREWELDLIRVGNNQSVSETSHALGTLVDDDLTTRAHVINELETIKHNLQFKQPNSLSQVAG